MKKLFLDFFITCSSLHILVKLLETPVCTCMVHNNLGPWVLGPQVPGPIPGSPVPKSQVLRSTENSVPIAGRWSGEG